MNRVLLGLMLTAILAVPASAQTTGSSAFIASSGVPNFHFEQPGSRTTIVPRFGGHRRHIHLPDHVFVGAFGYGPGYYDYGDYDANRGFDWWHERPERAFPRWVWRNQNCSVDRMWWSGAGWRCVP